MTVRLVLFLVIIFSVAACEKINPTLAAVETFKSASTRSVSPKVCEGCAQKCGQDERLPESLPTEYGEVTRVDFCATYTSSCDVCVDDQGLPKGTDCLLAESLCLYAATASPNPYCGTCERDCLSDPRLPDEIVIPEFPDENLSKSSFCKSTAANCLTCTPSSPPEDRLKCATAISTCYYVSTIE